MSIFLGAVKKKADNIYYIIEFYHKRNDEFTCELIEGAKDEKDAIKKAIKKHRENYPNMAIQVFSVWDNLTQIIRYKDGSKEKSKNHYC